MIDKELLDSIGIILLCIAGLINYWRVSSLEKNQKDYVLKIWESEGIIKKLKKRLSVLEKFHETEIRQLEEELRAERDP